ncbi:hypothetical protein A4A49_21474 [Nicotiana attenuata]|uniref:Secreted protein n=1 Tax=Nicotiana attenuata TaxID=49451 RepID=A0A314KLS8_NICAT|nr:hypothetical protein A4A49_21474 [Nicotiana attenuata]
MVVSFLLLLNFFEVAAFLFKQKLFAVGVLRSEFENASKIAALGSLPPSRSVALKFPSPCFFYFSILSTIINGCLRM